MGRKNSVVESVSMLWTTTLTQKRHSKETTTSNAHAETNGMGLTCMVAFEGSGCPRASAILEHSPCLFILTQKEGMNKKELEYLDRIALADSRFVDNKEWLEMMDAQYKVGQPSAIWCEAVILADTLMSVVIGKNIVFAKWGNRMKEMSLYAVKKMAVYILEHPIGDRNNLDYTELESIRNTIRLHEEKLMKSEKNRYVIMEDEPYEMNRGMVAECIAMAYVKKKAIKGIIKELIRFSKPFSTGLFSCMLSLISYYNNELDIFKYTDFSSQKKIFLFIIRFITFLWNYNFYLLAIFCTNQYNLIKK